MLVLVGAKGEPHDAKTTSRSGQHSVLALRTWHPGWPRGPAPSLLVSLSLLPMPCPGLTCTRLNQPSGGFLYPEFSAGFQLFLLIPSGLQFSKGRTSYRFCAKTQLRRKRCSPTCLLKKGMLSVCAQPLLHTGEATPGSGCSDCPVSHGSLLWYPPTSPRVCSWVSS